MTEFPSIEFIMKTVNFHFNLNNIRHGASSVLIPVQLVEVPDLDCLDNLFP